MFYPIKQLVSQTTLRRSSLLLLLILGGCNANDSKKPVTVRVNSPLKEQAAVVPINVEGGMKRDLGELEANTQSIVEFTLRNTSQTVVEFQEKVATSCSCSPAVLNPLKLQPGEHATLRTVVTVPNEHSVERDNQMTVEFEEAMSLPPLKFQFSYRSSRRWSVTPESLQLSGTVGSKQQVQLKFHRNRSRDAKVTGVVSTFAGVTFEIATSLPEDKSVTINALIKLPESPGRFTSYFTVTSDDSQQPSLIVPVNVQIVDEYELIPSRVVITKHADGKTPEFRNVLIRSANAFEVASIVWGEEEAIPVDATVKGGPPFTASIRLPSREFFNGSGLPQLIKIVVVELNSNRATTLNMPVRIIRSGFKTNPQREQGRFYAGHPDTLAQAAGYFSGFETASNMKNQN